MMRGEYYAPPPAPPKQAEKVHRKLRAAPKASPAMMDFMPPDDYGAGADAFGFSGGGAKKEEQDDEKQ